MQTPKATTVCFNTTSLHHSFLLFVSVASNESPKAMNNIRGSGKKEKKPVIWFIYIVSHAWHNNVFQK
jgi:hypothetical protein